jgi:hypothetical protein
MRAGLIDEQCGVRARRDLGGDFGQVLGGPTATRASFLLVLGAAVTLFLAQRRFRRKNSQYRALTPRPYINAPDRRPTEPFSTTPAQSARRKRGRGPARPGRSTPIRRRRPPLWARTRKGVVAIGAYLTAAIVLRAIRERALICFFRANPSAVTPHA